MSVTDPVLRAALFLHRHTGWSPDDLERADPDLVAIIEALALTEARAATKET